MEKKQYLIFILLIVIGLSFCCFIVFYELFYQLKINKDTIDIINLSNKTEDKYIPFIDDPLVIEEPDRDLGFITKRKIILNSTNICIKSQFINTCDSIKNISLYTNIDYDENKPYTIIFEQNEPKTIYIINEAENQNPNILTIGTMHTTK